MGIEFACIAPHGLEIIGDIAGDDYDLFAPTRGAMEKLGQLAAAAQLDTIVLATPHGFRLADSVSVATNSFAAGRLEKNGQAVTLSVPVDRTFALSLCEEGKLRDLPLSQVYFGSAEGSWSVLPLDWGSVIPLWFLGGRSQPPVEVVILTPCRSQGFAPLRAVGGLIAEMAERSGKRVGFVASADEGHAHDAAGPYGYNPESAVFDQMACEAVTHQDLSSLLDLDPAFLAKALPDSPWQIAILQGILDRVPMRGELLAYQVPTYYGLLTAAYSAGGR